MFDEDELEQIRKVVHEELAAHIDEQVESWVEMMAEASDDAQ